MSQTLSSNFNQAYQNQTGILNTLNNTLSPVVTAGLGQQGFTTQELADLNTGALNTTGANYANAARAVGSQLAGRTSDSGLESGIAQQIKGSVASSAAQQLSGEQSNIGIENAKQGQANYWKGVSGEQALAGEYNPQSYASLASSTGGQAFGEANTIQQQQNQLAKDITGGITSLAGNFIPGLSALGGGSMGASATVGGLAGTPLAGSLSPTDSSIGGQLTDDF